MLVKAIASLKYLSIPPRKMRLVADMVKDMPVEKALNVLNFTPKIAARHLAKTIKSAAANALSTEGTDRLRPEDLMISEIAVDNAPTAKRIQFQSMGRIFRIRKRHCHLTVRIHGEMDVEEAVKTAKKKTKKTNEAEPETDVKKTVAKKKATAKKATANKTTAKKKTTATAKAKVEKKPAAKTTKKAAPKKEAAAKAKTTKKDSAAKSGKESKE